MNISASNLVSANSHLGARKGPARKATESVAGAVGGVLGAALYTLPGAISGAEYSRDRRENRPYAGNDAVANIVAQGALLGSVAGVALGAASQGLLGAGIGLVSGFALGGAAGFGALLTQHSLAGRETLDKRLGEKIQANVDAGRGSISSDPYWPDTRTKTANIVKGFRAGAAAGAQVGFEIGKSEASGVASGLLDGAAGFGKALTYTKDTQPDGRGFVKKALNLPLGLVAGAVGAAVTVPGAVFSEGDWNEGPSVLKLSWGVAATATGAVIGGLVGGGSGFVNGAVLAGISSILIGMGEKSPIATRVNDDVRYAMTEGRRGRNSESEDGIHHLSHSVARDVVLGTAAGLNAGFSVGYRGVGVITDKLVDGTVAGAKALFRLGPKTAEVARGIKEGLS